MYVQFLQSTLKCDVNAYSVIGQCYNFFTLLNKEHCAFPKETSKNMDARKMLGEEHLHLIVNAFFVVWVLINII